ncbi:MAG: alpha/beta fold hydrolase [Bdellovibrionaceae bacterium]|nr:alpha/beta fold hydrolase [Pseudobdellovibrionaceae bacterium]
MSKEVSFKSTKDGVVLNGTFISAAEPKAAILFIVGSGKTDRDETAEGSQTFSGKKEKLFKQLAEAFSKAGYSSFRYDKRGVLDEAGRVDKSIWAKADREHLISDAVDAARFLNKDYAVKISDLIIVGHSEGTIVGVEAAISLSEKIKGLILLGAQARSMKDMLYYQIVESPHATSSGQNKNAIDDYHMALKMIETSTDQWAPDNKPMTWYKQFLKAPANQDRIGLIKAPIAIFQGEDDFSTPIDEIQRFNGLGLKNLSAKTYPGLGHSFSPNKNGQPTYGPIDQKVIADIVKAADGF